MNFLFLTFISLFLSSSSHAVLLDKIVAVVNSETILQSQASRVLKNLGARRTISPMIFNQEDYDIKKVVDIKINSLIIRNKLTELGYVISDEQVEAQIKSTEERLGLNRQALLDFLTSNNFSFDEYFELIRETIEYNLFLSRIVQPLISITDQDVKNAYFQKFSNQKRLNFKYDLVDFSLPESDMTDEMLPRFQSVLTSFQQTGILPEDFSDVSTNVLGQITEGGLNNALKKILSETNEGEFSKPIQIGGSYHVFFIKKKDLVESEDFEGQKNQIRAQLFNEAMGTIADSWLKSEAEKQYIKYFY